MTNSDPLVMEAGSPCIPSASTQPSGSIHRASRPTPIDLTAHHAAPANMGDGKSAFALPTSLRWGHDDPPLSTATYNSIMNLPSLLPSPVPMDQAALPHGLDSALSVVRKSTDLGNYTWSKKYTPTPSPFPGSYGEGAVVRSRAFMEPRI